MMITDTLKKQIIAIRDSGEYNMFDRHGVQNEANEREFYELVVLLEEHPDKYVRFILAAE